MKQKYCDPFETNIADLDKTLSRPCRRQYYRMKMTSPVTMVAKIFRNKLIMVLLILVLTVCLVINVNWPVTEFLENRSYPDNIRASEHAEYEVKTEVPLTCKKKFDVSFLKVHKAGSTTVMNIFLRFAIVNNLNIVLPPRSKGYGFNYLGYGETLSKERIVPLPANESYNILCNHVVYNKAAFTSVMPPYTKYVGILREPTSHFISAATYYGLYKNLKGIATERQYSEDVNVVSKFLQNQSSFKVSVYYTHNKQAFDFGLPTAKFNDVRYIHKYIEELTNDYRLVMLMERFDESLVLMKRVLCWSMKDILYVPLNSMGKKPNFNLSSTDLNNLHTWNKADYLLYDHFRTKFEKEVAAQGEGFNLEVKAFREVQYSTKLFCNSGSRNKNAHSVFLVPESDWSDEFNVTKHDCTLMMEAELPMMSRLIKNAWKKYNSSLEEST